MKRFNSKKQKGFSILAVILVIVAVIAAIGIWALSGQINTSNSGNSASDIQASAIINDSSSLKLAYDTLVVNGSSPSSIVFVPNAVSTGAAPNMLDPSTGVQVPKPNSAAIKSPAGTTEGYWVYNPTTFKGNTVGVAANADPVLLIAGVKRGVCERINNALYGSSTVPAHTVLTSAATTTSATVAAPTTAAALDLASVAGAAGWTAGCIGTAANGDDNVFFRVLKVN